MDYLLKFLIKEKIVYTNNYPRGLIYNNFKNYKRENFHMKT